MSDDKPAPLPVKTGGGSAKFSSPIVVWPAAILLAVLLYPGIGYFNDLLTHESTDDAFVAGHVISIAPRIAGQVTAVYVNDNQLVHSNDLLIEIDPADYALTVAQKTAAAESQNANYKTMFAAYQLMQTKVDTATAAVRKSLADANSAQATADIARTNLLRAKSLLGEKTVSQQEYDTTDAANRKAQADYQSALEAVAEDNSKVEEANRTLTAAREEATMALSQWTESQTNIAVARQNLSYTKIYAPNDGRITRKSVEIGDYLQIGQQIMSIVPTDVWVVANFKESQLKNMQPNQPVTVAVDALGGREFKGHVDSVQAGSGAQFSLLPPENATGNYVKVVQRVPVKIIFDEALPADHVIGPGLSVTPSVAVSQYVLPVWLRAALAILTAVVIAIIVLLLGRSKPAVAP